MERETVILERDIMPIMKECARCKTTMELSSFPTKKGKHIGICRDCYSKHYGDPDKIDEKLRETDRRHQAARLERSRGVIHARLKHGCMDCGEMNPVVLEFDHRNPAEKVADISKLMHNGSISKLEKELSKCDVVCANCHRKRTVNMFGGWKALLKKEE